MAVLVKFQIEMGFFIELQGNSKLSMTSCPPSSGFDIDRLDAHDLKTKNKNKNKNKTKQNKNENKYKNKTKTCMRESVEKTPAL